MSKPAKKTQLSFETLEDRANPSSYVDGSGNLIITGTDAADSVTVQYESSYSNGYYYMPARLKVYENGALAASHMAYSVSGKIYFHGYGGNDYFNNYAGGWAVWANGYGGNDTLIGDAQADWLEGGTGDDTLYGYGGDDALVGQDGNDRLYGMTGNDTLIGAWYGWAGESGGADDVIYGGAGNDLLYSGVGDDRLYGGDGDDALYGEWGNDRLFGEAGSDRLYGGDNTDWLEAGAAWETADGGAGMDWNAHDWATGDWWLSQTQMDDVDQEGSGTCVFLAALAGAADRTNLENNITYAGNYNYDVRLFDPGTSQWVTERVRFDGTMVYNSAGVLVDPATALTSTTTRADEGDFWTVLYQRAYLQRFAGINPMNGDAVAAFGGESDGGVRATRAITGLNATMSTTFNRDTMRQQLAEGRILTAGGTGHRYTVLDIYQDGAGTWMVRLRNPWATDAVHNGMTFNAEGANDGIITMTWANFSNSSNFANYGFSG